MKRIKISENIYNGHYSAGSVFENSVLITLNDNEVVERLSKDKINNAKLRRTFTDKNMNFISIEIPAPIIDKYNELEKCLNELTSNEEYILHKTLSFNLKDYMEKITIMFSDKEEEYEINKFSDLGKKIMDLSALSDLKSKSNKDIIDSIEI